MNAKILLLALIALLVLPVPCFTQDVESEDITADVTLEWDPNPEPDLAGYYVYQADRFEDKTGAWQKITPDLATETIFVVTGLDTRNYAWMVTAVDATGNESFVSNMVERYDRTPPGDPKNLRKGGQPD